ncbi:MAG: hypothetical protein IT318_00145 [Anaerolineales bacterium]|nr:hypothetical protein [Anaerolineales bacterium]
MSRVVRTGGLAVLVVLTWIVAGCNSPTAPPAATQSPATQRPATQVPAAATSAPVATATAPATEPTTLPTAAPTEPPAVEASPTTPRETVTFVWAPGSVTPADADDVAEIVKDLRANPGILGGNGDEIAINVSYDPTVITVEEIMEILDDLGHPVQVQ